VSQPNSSHTGIFDGLKVADFSWAAAGPIATKHLADNGATVVKVESARHPDSIRLGGPFAGDEPGINRSGFFADFNSSKLGLSVDMRHPRAREVIEPLIQWADVVAESFRPGVMDRWGFGYQRLRELNPRIIMFSSSLYGSGGPYSDHPGFGMQGQAVAGIHGMTGWPDRPPAIPKGAYSDSVSPRFGVAALVAALVRRERTGLGEHLEMSQVEATAGLLAPELLDLQITGHLTGRQGNADPTAILHGVFPCRGHDRWIAIEVRDEQAWQRCVDVLTADRPRPAIFDSAPQRRPQDREEIESSVDTLTAERDAFELMAELRLAGVAAGVALHAPDLFEDEALRTRNHFWPLDHPEMGTTAYNGPAYRFETTPHALTKAAPLLGEDTEQVLREFLHLSPARIRELAESGLLS
jgi:benzylsuccinate CoA-transferase BbsF subunit